MLNLFERADEDLVLKPFMLDWGFTISRHNAEIYRERRECYKIGEFVSEYIKSIHGNCDIIAAPDAITISGRVFGHNKFPHGTGITTAFIETIRVLKNDNTGILYCGTTEYGHDYYFHSEDADDLFNQKVNRATAALSLILDRNSDIIPICVL